METLLTFIANPDVPGEASAELAGGAADWKKGVPVGVDLSIVET